MTRLADGTECDDCYYDENDAFWMFLAREAHGGSSSAGICYPYLEEDED